VENYRLTKQGGKMAQGKIQSIEILFLLLGLLGGFLLGEYSPFTGAFGINPETGQVGSIPYMFVKIAQPFSFVRNITAINYAIVGAFIGALIGTAFKKGGKK